MSDRARAAAVHFTPAYGQVDRNRRALLDVARQAAEAARVVVLPELATTGFVLGPSQAEAWAEDPDGPTAAALDAVAAAHEALLVVGLVLRGAAGQLHNAQLVLGGAGRPLGVYAKHHLYGADHGWATPGESPGALIEAGGERLGLLICHDIVYPETVAALGALKPSLVCFSTNWIGAGEAFPSAWGEAVQRWGGPPLIAANRGGAEATARFEDPSAIVHLREHGVQAQVGPRGAGPYVLPWKA